MNQEKIKTGKLAVQAAAWGLVGLGVGLAVLAMGRPGRPTRRINRARKTVQNIVERCDRLVENLEGEFRRDAA